MPVRRNIPETSGIYSITFTCTNWLALFEIANAYNSVYNWFDVLKRKGHYIVGYTIMPNHLHAVIAFVNKGFFHSNVSSKAMCVSQGRYQSSF